MTQLKRKPLVIALAGALLVGQIALAAETKTPQSVLQEEISTTPGRAITRADEAMVSAAANKVLRHIAKARDAIRRQNADGAKQELRQAETLMDIIRDVAPTTVVKDRMWTADKKLSYENTEEVGPGSVPIFSDLGEREVVNTVKLKTAKAGAKGNPALGEEAEAADVMLYYEELGLPLGPTRHFIAVAQAELRKKRLDAADQALRAAQDSVDFVGVFLPEPLLAARVNLERAHAHYSAGKLPQAKADVTTAIGQMEAAAGNADPAAKADVDKLLNDAKSLQARIDKGETTLGGELRSLWRHTDALADRAMESTAVGWARLRQHGKARADLIEAKRYVAYADIDANVGKEPDKARAALVKARDALERAAQDSAGKSEAEVFIKDARAMVDSLLAGQAKTDPGEMANLKSQLAQALGKL